MLETSCRVWADCPRTHPTPQPQNSLRHRHVSFAPLAVHVGVLPGLDIRSRRCVEPPGAAPSLDVAPLNMKQLLIGVGWLFLGAIVLFGWPLRSDRPRAT